MDSQLYQIRAKKIGLRMMMARLKVGLSIDDLSRQVGIEPADLAQMEKGILCPSLPQLQYIAPIIQMPLDDLINTFALAPIPQGLETSALPKYYDIRNRMLGIQIKKNRMQQNLSEDQLAQVTDVNPSDIESYETGQKLIPFPVLMKISEYLHLPYELQPKTETLPTEITQIEKELPSELIVEQEEEPVSPLPESLPELVEETPTPPTGENNLPGLSNELRDFINKPSNLPFLELAMKLSHMDAKRLRDIAESILEITL
jgi:transcriptional regulator with XRE-family HTH domain